MTPEPDRRSFLGFAIFGLGAIFSAILGIPIVCFFVDPRNRKAPASSFKLVDGIKLDELAKAKQGVVRDTRMDGWTLYPNAVIGRVWVIPVGARPAFATVDEVNAFNRQSITEKERILRVFTTTCPHLGCSVNLDDAANGFACPCHNAVFTLNGASVSGPQKRGMDTLAWEVDETDPTFNRIKVEFKRFQTSIEEKKLLA